MKEASGSMQFGRGLVASLATLGLLTSLVVYRPDRDLPFDFVDFSEFLPLLQQGDDFTGRMAALLDYYAGQQGRLNVVAYIGMAAKWGIWGDSSSGWQWMRFAIMWTLIVLAYHLLRRVGATRAASLAGASVFLFAPPAVDGWIRLTMAEPLGTVLLLTGCFLAVSPQKESGEARLGLGFAVLCALLVLLKEMLAATLLLPIALVAVSDRTRIPRPARRLRLITAGAFAGVLAGGIPVAIVALRARADAYTAEFGARLRSPVDALAQWSLGIFPFDPGTSFPPRLTGLAILALASILVAGWTLRLRRGDSKRRESRWLLMIGLVFPLVGTATYLPWPSYNRFYAIPFLLGGAVLAAVALSSLEGQSRRVAFLSYAVWVSFLTFAGADAAAQSTRMAVRQRVNATVVARLSALTSRTDTVYLATEQRAPTYWQGIGPTLQRYGEALGFPMPPVTNASCDESRRLALARESTILIYSSLCPRMPRGDAIVSRYRRLRLPSLRPVSDSIRVDLVLPADAQRRPDAVP